MTFIPLLLVLPALVYASINIEIEASDPKNSQVLYTGSSIEIINDNDVQAFGLTDGSLKSASQRFSGGRPDDVYLKSPTPWNDLYKTFGWFQVQRTLYPRSARILGIRTEPVVLVSNVFINNSTVKSTYNAVVSQDVEETVSNTWKTGGELKIEQEIKYTVQLGFGEIGGATTFGFSSNWGRETTRSKSIKVGSTQGVTVELEPGQAVLATLQANRGTMEVQVDYSASLSGDVACNYQDTYRGHHFWRYDVNAVQRAGNLRRSVDSTEIIKIGFYSDARVMVTDQKSKNRLGSFAALYSVI